MSQRCLESEVEKRVGLGLDDEEGPWKLIAWLEGVQPPFESQGRLVPILRAPTHPGRTSRRACFLFGFQNRGR